MVIVPPLAAGGGRILGWDFWGVCSYSHLVFHWITAPALIKAAARP